MTSSPYEDIPPGPYKGPQRAFELAKKLKLSFNAKYVVSLARAETLIQAASGFDDEKTYSGKDIKDTLLEFAAESGPGRDFTDEWLIKRQQSCGS